MASVTSGAETTLTDQANEEVIPSIPLVFYLLKLAWLHAFRAFTKRTLILWNIAICRY